MRIHSYRQILILTFILVALPFSISRAGDKAIGVRAGFGLDPDQVVVGVQGVTGKVAGPIDFAPSFDIGFGDNVTTFDANPDFRLRFSPPDSRAALYVSAGPTFAVFNPDNGDSDLQVGLSLNGGVLLSLGKSYHYNLEGRFGIDNIPDFRLLLGVMF